MRVCCVLLLAAIVHVGVKVTEEVGGVKGVEG